MEFEIRPDYTVEDFAAFWHGFLEKRPGKRDVRRLSDRGMWRGGWLFLLGGISLLAVSWFNPLELSSVPFSMVFMALAFLALGVVTLIQWRPGRPEPLRPYWARRFWKKWSKQDPKLRWTYRFTPEGVELHNAVSDHRYDYSGLRQVWQDKDHFYLTLDGRVWHILNKSQFTRGDPAQFAAFVAERAGKPVGWVNGEEDLEKSEAIS